MKPRALPIEAFWLLSLVLASPVAAQVTEVPTTASKGAWLLEVDVLSVAVDRHTPFDDGVHYRSTVAGWTLLSTGLTEKFDVQFGYEFWREETASGGGLDERYSGQGDAWIRCKWNFAGDESTGPAWALLPYVKLPFADREIGNDHVEPGAMLVLGMPWGEQATVQANAGFDWLDDYAGGRDVAVYASTVATRTLNDMWAAYLEFSFWMDLPDSANWWGQVGAGVIYTLNERGWIDCVVYTGLTRAAPDVMPVLRFGWQF